MLTITCVLVVITVLGLFFEATRLLGIVATALLCVLYPLPTFAFLIVGAALWYFLFVHH